MPQPGLISEVDGNCSGGREKRQGCVKECFKVEKPHKTLDYRRLRIKNSGNSHRRQSRSCYFPNSWPCRASRQWQLPVARSYWPSETTDPEGQPTGNGEESI